MTVVEAALGWLGTPYHSGARLKGVGVDCCQLIIAAYEECGYINPHECNPGPYSNEWHLHRSEELYLKNLSRFCDSIDVPAPGDIAAFRFGRCVSHGGIVLDVERIIHAYVGHGVIISALSDVILCDKAGRSRLYGFYRLKERSGHGRAVRKQ